MTGIEAESKAFEANEVEYTMPSHADQYLDRLSLAPQALTLPSVPPHRLHCLSMGALELQADEHARAVMKNRISSDHEPALRIDTDEERRQQTGWILLKRQ